MKNDINIENETVKKVPFKQCIKCSRFETCKFLNENIVNELEKINNQIQKELKNVIQDNTTVHFELSCKHFINYQEFLLYQCRQCNKK